MSATEAPDPWAPPSGDATTRPVPQQPAAWSAPAQPAPPLPASGPAWSGPPGGPYAAHPAYPVYGAGGYPSSGSAVAQPRPGRTLGVVAVVLSGVACLLAAAALVVALSAGVGPMEGGYTLDGQVPQVSAGQPVSGQQIATAVQDAYDKDGGSATMNCDDVAALQDGATSNCKGKVEGWDTGLTVTFTGTDGSFTLEEN
ncbi:hypothetical protein G9U51_07960 [Calidifontibacter sp. DB0510]|uniref:DUF4333 domain-containing protein n=1 Tax=Metallococcus carri TaxID=1656884 RepID=A0A967AZ16_9MICO|nr:hypothetical protein [Metallococcus carri]NHN55709.1 hypothetical protein [Metallococcus carri]NOP38602.1 hypothetical protein [Calidifontibacter sp. DB2511S]